MRINHLGMAVFMILAWGASLPAAVLGLLIPAYFDPGTPPGNLWDEVASAARQVPVIAIMNPNNGPGQASDATYVAALRKVRAAGGKVIGYVSTRYGQRPIGETISDVDRYLSFYAVDGIFFDEIANDNGASHRQYYASLYRNVKAHNPAFLVVGNPGTRTQSFYLTDPAADLLVMLETDAGSFASYQPSAWVRQYGAAHFAYLAYDASATQLPALARQAQQQGAGYIYVTNDQLPNPWDTLPGYLAQEIQVLGSHSANTPTVTPTPAPVSLPPATSAKNTSAANHLTTGTTAGTGLKKGRSQRKTARRTKHTHTAIPFRK